MTTDPATKFAAADRVGAGVFGLLWLAGWTLGVLAFDSILGYRAARQTIALFHPTVQGTVLRCEFTEYNDTCDLKVEYEYAVAGHPYTGTRFAHVPMWSPVDSPRTAAEHLRPDDRVTVHYSPFNPADAVLAPGLRDGDLFIWLFLTPFNIVMLLGWRALYCYIRGRAQDTSLEPIGPWTAATLAALACSLVSIFIVGFAGGGMLLTSIAWGVVLGVSGWVFVRRWQRLQGNAAKSLTNHSPTTERT